MIVAGLVGSVLVAAVGGVRRPKRSAKKKGDAAPPAPDRPAPSTPDRPSTSTPDRAAPRATATASVPAAYRLDPGQYPPPPRS
jgi:hypothetical protein